MTGFGEAHKRGNKGCMGLHDLVAARTGEILSHPVVAYNSESLEAGAIYHFCMPNRSFHAKPKGCFLDLWVIVGSAEFPFHASLFFLGGGEKCP